MPPTPSGAVGRGSFWGLLRDLKLSRSKFVQCAPVSQAQVQVYEKQSCILSLQQISLIYFSENVPLASFAMSKDTTKASITVSSNEPAANYLALLLPLLV